MAAEVFEFTVAGENGVETKVAVPQESVAAAIEGKGWVRQEKIGADIDRRVRSIIEKQGLKKPEELLKDEDFLKQARDGFVPVGTGHDGDAQKQLLSALEKQRQDLENREIKPREEKLTAAQQREEALLARDLDRQLGIALRDAGVKKALLPAAVAMLRERMALNDEDGEFYVADDSDNFVLSKTGGKNVYQTVAEGVADWAGDATNADWLDNQAQGGPGVATGKGRRGDGGEPGTIQVTEEQARDGNFMAQQLAKVGGDWQKIRIKRDQGAATY